MKKREAEREDRGGKESGHSRIGKRTREGEAQILTFGKLGNII